MKWGDRFRFVRQNMKKNKSRVFMTVLATAMGCSFLIVLASVGFGLQKSVVNEITGDSLLTEISVYGKEERKNLYSQLKDADIAELEQIPNVKSVTRRITVGQQLNLRVGDQVTSQQGVIMHIPSEVKAGFKLEAGRMPQSDREVIVGYQFAESLRKAGEAIEEDSTAAEPEKQEQSIEEMDKVAASVLNKTMDMEVKRMVGKAEEKTVMPVTIVGVASKPTREWMNDRKIYLSDAMLREIESYTNTRRGDIIPPELMEKGGAASAAPIDGEREYAEVHIYADNVKDVKGIADVLEERSYANHSIVNELEQVNVMFTIMKIGLLLVGTIAVLIASIGIYNTMTMAVTERAQDIGIMKAIGAHPSTVKSVFLIESTYIGVLGALIGTVVSYVISFAVNLSLPAVISGFMGENPPEGLIFSDIPPSLTLICVAISLVVAMLSGLRPAKRATQVDVLKALRRDV
ncbi:ABC transporter permease [Paenibacillus koleovorans]|uniref:ABC transporter permease n=1 Tax=Paenibacillus koleovorans TaxID=121608 RepID=UPI000FD7D2C9|nr:ABC transporter permease [Paenibacillus koleovorans]